MTEHGATAVNLVRWQKPRGGPIGTRLLSLRDQIVRRPLVPWGRDIISAIGAVATTGSRSAESMTLGMRYANNAALVASYCGHYAAAGVICHAQIDAISREIMRTGNEQVCTLAFDPWINLGRLKTLDGDIAGAMKQFAAVYSQIGSPCTIGPGAIAGPMREQLRDSSTDISHVARSAYYIDSVRALFRCAQYERVLDFLDVDWIAVPPSLALTLSEALVVALGRLGRIDDAMAIARQYIHSQDPWARLVMRTRLAELLLTDDSPERAARTLSTVARACFALRLFEKPRLDTIPIAQTVSTLLQALGDAAGKLLADEALRGARFLDDEVLQIELLSFLVAGGYGLDDDLDSLTKETSYVRFCSVPETRMTSQTIIDLSSAVLSWLDQDI